MDTNLKEGLIIENFYLYVGLSNMNDTLYVKDKTRIIDWEVSEETKK
ncbi:hypothetical protein [Flavobacterium sp. SOK18b]|nr:hypothetical protein [Flavobacterium sp. SOK18b]